MKRILLVFQAFLALGMVTALSAQDCTLGIGGKDSDVIVQVFKLTAQQQSKMQVWMGELAIYQKEMNSKVRQLLDTHPQQRMEEIQLLATKYGALKDEMEAMASTYDRKLLATFDERQYERYQALCMEANRIPLGRGSDKLPVVITPE